MRQLGFYFAVTLVPLIPAIVLYWAFGTENIAGYVSRVRGIKLGGPVAAYFIIMITGFAVLHDQFEIEDPEFREITRNYREHQTTSSALEGNWYFEATVRKNQALLPSRPRES